MEKSTKIADKKNRYLNKDFILEKDIGRMFLQINGIGSQKIDYKDHSDINFDSLSTYILLAKKAISKFSNRFYNGLSLKMLSDEDAIASIANAIMMADWRWDENYNSPNGTRKTRYSYRNQCALWAMQTYVSKNYKHKKKFKKKVYSLDHSSNDDESVSVHEIVSGSCESPLDELIDKEEKTILTENLEALLSSSILTDRQRDYIKLYFYDGYTFEKIGKKYGITREAVRQGLNKAINAIKDLVK